MAKGKDECPDGEGKGKEEEEEEEERTRAGGDVISLSDAGWRAVSRHDDWTRMSSTFSSRPVLFNAHLHHPPPLQQLQTSCPLSPIELDRYGSESHSTYNTPTLASSEGLRGVRWRSVGVGTLLVAFPDPPYRRYQDSRPTDQCRERRRRLGVHRRLLGRTAGHRRTLENRLMALQDPT